MKNKQKSVEKLTKQQRFKRKESKTPPGRSHTRTNNKNLTPEEAAAIVRDRLANRPVIMWRYPNGKYNKRFIITLAIMIVALIASLYLISRV